ncbi:MAG TPA: carbonic anhydrase family protein [Thermomicrobiales bacterium]
MCKLCSDLGAARLSRRTLVRAGAAGAGAFGLAVAGRGWIVSEAADATPTAGGTPTPAHWTYEGEEGPAHWGDLDPAYAACSQGTAQSPIDIANPTHGDVPDLTFAEQALSPIRIINNGHTIQVTAPPGNTIAFDGTTYELTQFHFHTPSEHQIDGKAQAMELHLVHKDQDGNLAVLAVLLTEGAENAALKPVFDNMPPTAGPEQSVDGTVNLSDLLPADKSTYRYDGSLTTPPCSEGVKWVVFVQTMDVSKEQAAAFRGIFAENARPVQPLNGRTIVESE